MRHMPLLSDVMTAFPLHVDEDLPLNQAAALMDEHHCHHLPVLNGHVVSGLLTSEDIKLALQPGHSARELTELTAGDLCRRQVPQVDLHTRLDVVLQGHGRSGPERRAGAAPRSSGRYSDQSGRLPRLCALAAP